MGPNERPLLELKNVDMDFKQGRGFFHALQDINFSVYDKDFICLLGPSGSGKTSILNLLAGYNRPTRGEVLFDGSPHLSPTPEIGVVFQQQNLFPWLSVYKNVEFGLKKKNISAGERKDIVEHYLKLVGLEAAAEKLPHQLSGGMKQRATIARTLAPDPRIVLFDEPFSALDALTREKMQEHVHAIWKKSGKCFFFITHDVDEALTLSRRIIVMKAEPGRIQADYKNPIGGSAKFSGSIRDVKGYREIREEIISMIQSKDDIEIMRLLKEV